MIKKLKAITLVETLVYLALFGIFFITVMQFLFFLQEFESNAESRLLLNQNSIFLSEHLKETLKDTKSVDLANSQLDQDLGKLRIIKNDNTYVEYSINSNRIEYTKELSSPVPLSKSIIGINKLRFQAITDQSGSKIIAVRVVSDLYITNKPGVSRVIETLYTL
jgi:hypothetical protein